MRLDPLVRCAAGRVPKVEQTFGVFVSVGIGERGGSTEAGYATGDEVLLVGGEVITGFGRVPAFPDCGFSSLRQLPVDLGRRRKGGGTYHVQTGNLYERKSPAATNSSASGRDVRSERNGVRVRTRRRRTWCYPTVFLELAFLEYLGDMVSRGHRCRDTGQHTGLR